MNKWYKYAIYCAITGMVLISLAVGLIVYCNEASESMMPFMRGVCAFGGTFGISGGILSIIAGIVCTENGFWDA